MNYDPDKRLFVTKLLASKGLGNANKSEHNAKHSKRSKELHEGQIALGNERFCYPYGELAKKALERDRDDD